MALCVPELCRKNPEEWQHLLIHCNKTIINTTAGSTHILEHGRQPGLFNRMNDTERCWQIEWCCKDGWKLNCGNGLHECFWCWFEVKLLFCLMVSMFCVCVLQLKEKCVYDVKLIVQSITKGARNELERLRAIWVWLCHNIGGYFTLNCTYLHINPSNPVLYTQCILGYLPLFKSRECCCLHRVWCEWVPRPLWEAELPRGRDSGWSGCVLWLLQPLHGDVQVITTKSNKLGTMENGFSSTSFLDYSHKQWHNGCSFIKTVFNLCSIFTTSNYFSNLVLLLPGSSILHQQGDVNLHWCFNVSIKAALMFLATWGQQFTLMLTYHLPTKLL